VTYCLELRSTANWEGDIRYRAYTKSLKTVERFKTISKIQFSDSGHGIVPVVSEDKFNRKPTIRTLWEYVEAHYEQCDAKAKRDKRAIQSATRSALQMQLDLAREEIARLTEELERYKKFGPGSKDY
jgi:hypothetical protein